MVYNFVASPVSFQYSESILSTIYITLPLSETIDLVFEINFSKLIDNRFLETSSNIRKAISSSGAGYRPLNFI